MPIIEASPPSLLLYTTDTSSRGELTVAEGQHGVGMVFRDALTAQVALRLQIALVSVAGHEVADDPG